MEGEFTRGTVAIDKEGNVTDILLCDEGKVKVTVVIPQGVLGNYTSYDHELIWRAYKAAQPRIDAIVKAKFAIPPTESCTITLEKSDLETRH